MLVLRSISAVFLACLAACGLESLSPVDRLRTDAGPSDFLPPPGTDAGPNNSETDGGPNDVTDGGPTDLTDGGVVVDDAYAPILFVHGINGAANDFDTLKSRLVFDGWSADRLFAHTFSDPEWGCNVDNAAALSQWVDEILASTGATKVDVVAHSMGTLSSRYLVKFLNGSSRVRTYVTLGGQHHGLWEPCAAALNPFGNVPCVWDELCASGDFIASLNAAPATPGPARWVSIYSTEDEIVPSSQSELDGVENIELHGVSHMGLIEDEAAYTEIVDVLSP